MPRIGIIVLAAGVATRFAPGRVHKLLALLDRVPLVRFGVSAALEADVGEVVVVTGAQGADVAAALNGLRVRVVHEPKFADGMATSLRRGVQAFRSADAVMIGLGDQPRTRPEAYRRLAARWRTTRASIVVPRYAGSAIPAHPTLFAGTLFDELLALRGDVGARAIISRDPSRVVEEPLEWSAPADVDTLDDLEAVSTELSRPRAPLGDRSRHSTSTDTGEPR